MSSIPGPNSNTLGYIIELSSSGSPTETAVYFDFNPQDISLQQSRGGGGSGSGSSSQGPWAPAGTQSRPRKGGTGGNNAAPTMHSRTGSSATKVSLVLGKMFFDGGFTRSVMPDCWTLYNWFKPANDGTSGSPTPSPPTVAFYLGGKRWFTGTLSNLNIKFTIFTPDGEPTRAEVTQLTIDGDEIGLRPQNPTSGGLASYSAVVVAAGDSLEAIAYRTYGHPRLWRELAIVNGIDDPLRVRPGMAVMLPTLNEIVKVV